MSLRSDATQAIAEEVCESYGEEGPCDDHVRKAERVLDALLDYLEAHALEWKREGGRVSWEKSEAGITDTKRNEAVSNLIDALRVEP